MAEPVSLSVGISKVDDDDDEVFAAFLESEILSGSEDKGEALAARATKKPRIEDDEETRSRRNRDPPRSFRQIETGLFSKIPREIVHHIFKFLSSEDLVSCALVCKFMNTAASDESLWRRLYFLRWGLGSSRRKMLNCAWKMLYIKRDREETQFVWDTPSEFKEYYIQMQAAKRSQAPLPSEVNDDRVIFHRTVAERLSMWESKRGLSDKTPTGHFCSGKTCSYTRIGNVFICERTGSVHVCDDTCREVILGRTTLLPVCTISGRCFDGRFLPTEEQHQDSEDEEAEFFTSERFVRAYLLGYNFTDKKELRAALGRH